MKSTVAMFIDSLHTGECTIAAVSDPAKRARLEDSWLELLEREAAVGVELDHVLLPEGDQ